MKRISTGIENFKELLDNNYYYVDKTLLIKDLIDLRGEVNLFTRPRRFGKTLNMSMLRYFFEKNDSGDNGELFAGTKIMGAGEQYVSEMGRYPVISISLKSMKQADYGKAFYCLKEEIARRRTFGIVSHPDAGKTTLTEKLLLFGGAIHVAGAVKSNKIKKS